LTTISLTKGAYRALVRLKRRRIIELILRITKEKERVWDYFGSIPLTQKEENDIMESIDKLETNKRESLTLMHVFDEALKGRE